MSDDRLAGAWRGNLVVFALFGALATLFFAPLLSHGLLQYNVDNHVHYLPYKHFIAEALRSGVLPLWNPLTGIGMPVAGNPQYGLFYPANVLFVLLPPLAAQAVYILLHAAMSGTFTYVYARRLRLRAPAALLAGILYAFTGPALMYHAFLPMIAALPWLPAAAIAIESYRRHRRLTSVVAAAFAFALPVLAGHPQYAVNIWLVLAVYVAWLSVTTADRGLAAGIGLGALLGAGLSAVLVLPVQLLLPHLNILDNLSLRNLQGAMRPDMLLDLFEPHAGGELYLGLLPLPLAIYCVVHRRRLPREQSAWIPVAAVSVVLMLGYFTPLWDIVRYTPGLKNLRFSIRHDIGLAFAAAVLSACAVEHLASATGARRKAQWRWLRRNLGALLFFGLVATSFVRLAGYTADQVARDEHPATSTPVGTIWRQGNRTGPARPPALQLGIVALSFGALVLFLRRRSDRAAWLLGVVALLDLRSLLGTPDASGIPFHLVNDNPVVAALAADHRGGELPRVAFNTETLDPWPVLWGSSTLLYGLPALNIHDPIQHRVYARATDMHLMGKIRNFEELVRDNRLMSLLGARYLVASPELWQRVGPMKASLAPADRPQRVASIDAEHAPTKLVDARAVDDGFSLARKKSSAAQLITTVHLEPFARYELSVEARSAGASAPLMVDLFAPGRYDDAAQQITMEPQEIGTKLTRVSRLINSDNAPATAQLRAFSKTTRPIAIHRVALHRLPLPRIRDADHHPLPPGRREALLYPLVHPLGDAELRRNRAAMPHAWLARELVPASSPEHALAALRETATVVDPGRTVLLEGLDRPRTLRGGTVRRVVRGINTLSVEVESEGQGLLVVSALYLPGWQVSVNDEPARLARAFGLLRAVAVPNGRSTVRMRYVPQGFIPGAALSLFALLGCGGLLWLQRRRRRSTPAPSGARRPRTGQS